jgi:hypothetical protein
MKSKNSFYFFLLLIFLVFAINWSYSQNPVTNTTSGRKIAENVYLLKWKNRPN